MKEENTILDDFSDREIAPKKTPKIFTVLFAVTFILVSYGLMAPVLKLPYKNMALYSGIAVAGIYFIVTLIFRLLHKHKKNA